MAKPCFVCSKPLVNVMGRPITPVTRDHHGVPVQMHATCSRTYDDDAAEARVTARAPLTGIPDSYKDGWP